MSFILDAIAKSERERQQQEIPDARILATPVRNTHQPRRILPYLLAGALLLNVIVLLVWMQTDNSSFAQFPYPEKGVIEPSPAHNTTADNVLTPNQNTNLPASDSAYPLHQAAENSGAKTSNPALAPPASKTVLPEQSIARPRNENRAGVDNSQGSLEANMKSTTTPKKANILDGSGDNYADIEPHDSSGVNGSSAFTRQTTIRHAVEPAPRKISRLSELPDDVRRDLPSVTFTGHLYSKNIASRYVLVEGGRTVFSGQQIADEIILHEVTPTGAIVNFRGFLIEVGVLQNWSLK